MCKLFIGADKDLWETTTRSMRFDGVVTSIRLENFFWLTLEEIAERDGYTVSKLINRLYFESVEDGHDMGNFTSFLRVCCHRYLALQLSGRIPSAADVKISSLPAEDILRAERAELAERAKRSRPESLSETTKALPRLVPRT